MELSDMHRKWIAIGALTMLLLVVTGFKSIGLVIVSNVLAFWGIGGTFLIEDNTDSTKARLWKAFPMYIWVELYFMWLRRKKKKNV
jgi:hypothetical protein